MQDLIKLLKEIENRQDDLLEYEILPTVDNIKNLLNIFSELELDISNDTPEERIHSIASLIEAASMYVQTLEEKLKTMIDNHMEVAAQLTTLSTQAENCK